MHACLWGKYLNKLEKLIAVESNFIEFAKLQPQLTQLQSQPGYT